MVERLKTPKLAEAIAGHLERLILEGVLRPGEKLASERDLAERLDVSRPSLRDALAILETRGLLSTGREGTRVTQFLAGLTDPLAGLLQSNEAVTADYFEYRAAVETTASGLAAIRATEPEREAIRDCLAEMETAHRAEDPTREAEADLVLHRLIYAASHNLVILHVMRAFSEMLRRDIFFNRTSLFANPAFRDDLLAQHQAIGRAIIDADQAAAEAAAHHHLKFTGDSVEKTRRDAERADLALRRLNRSTLLGG
ncbi:GntR family transcriptional repressor for pyruvate dehydrogenase complex [Angulomicrobium tetraedrale]|uniref:Pyruvate dehydrogenase complex repressor n=1 Tax=Ancylobacter tetraedralis TaxID=217068 RepID=A0A839Z6R7_9HYPH|nr:FCD domain-containing protein [Ancylobacter tetraedralis]MBB3769788.1 GntR family transcriptional repressor for pyruvate dehydrogenase complex [Ancylobacter tetraedralis]